MMNIQLPTGKTISVSTYEWLFLLKEEDIDEFYQQCMADDLGQEITDPFNHRTVRGKLEIDETPDFIEDEEEK